jgi:hypothetical protein
MVFPRTLEPDGRRGRGSSPDDRPDMSRTGNAWPIPPDRIEDGGAATAIPTPQAAFPGAPG